LFCAHPEDFLSFLCVCSDLFVATHPTSTYRFALFSSLFPPSGFFCGLWNLMFPGSWDLLLCVLVEDFESCQALCVCVSVCACVFVATRYRVSCSSTYRGLCIMFHIFASVLKKNNKFKSIRARKFQEG
jgi:hypothetical protein